MWVRNSQVRRLALSGIAKRVIAAMEYSALSLENKQEKQPPCVQAFATHDVTLIPLLFALGVWSCKVPTDEDPNPNSEQTGSSRWPGYGAAVVWELYQDSECSNCSVKEDWLGWYVKIFVYQGVGTEQTRTMIDEEGLDEWLCPPSSVIFDNIQLPCSDYDSGSSLKDQSPLGKDEILVPMKHFVHWLQQLT